MILGIIVAKILANGTGKAMNGVIFQASDLAGNKRTAFIAAARDGRARLRDKDGKGLVMLPEHDLDVLETFARWSQLVGQLSALARREGEIAVSEFGELAWLRVFDRDDMSEFLADVENALFASLADNDYNVLESTIADWRTTARQLEDPMRRSVLLGRHNPLGFEDASAPTEK
jgi:hypothetical protein